MTTKTLLNWTTATCTYNGPGVTLVNAGIQGAPGANGLNYGSVVKGNNGTLVNNGTVFGRRSGILRANPTKKGARSIRERDGRLRAGSRRHRQDGSDRGIGAFNATNLACAHDTPSSSGAMTEPASGPGA